MCDSGFGCIADRDEEAAVGIEDERTAVVVVGGVEAAQERARTGESPAVEVQPDEPVVGVGGVVDEHRVLGARGDRDALQPTLAARRGVADLADGPDLARPGHPHDRGVVALGDQRIAAAEESHCPRNVQSRGDHLDGCPPRVLGASLPVARR